MSTMAETWTNIDDNIEIINKVIDTELYDIDNQSEGDVFVSMMTVKMRIICL